MGGELGADTGVVGTVGDAHEGGVGVDEDADADADAAEEAARAASAAFMFSV
jgi:hypothetical protein